MHVCDSRHLQQMELMRAQREVNEQKTLEQEKMKLHREIKRRIALETIVGALEVRATNMMSNSCDYM